MAAVVELEACVAEVNGMLTRASRPTVKEELERVRGVFQAELEEAKKKEAATALSATEAAAAEVKLLLGEAKRPKVKQELQGMLQKFSGSAVAQRASGETDVPAAAKASSAPASGAVAAMEVDAGAEPTSVQKPPKEAEQKAPAKVDVRSSGPWTEITTYAQDLGGYSGAFVTVDVRLKGVEQLPEESVTCSFTNSSFDLRVLGLDGKNHRMLKTNLDKDIVVNESSVKVKKNHVIVSMKKVKGEYGFDSWTDLCAKGKRRPAADKSENPQSSIMGMMQDMYNDGDDSMKKIIGEAMYKAQRGEKYEPDMDGLKPKGSDSLDDL